MQNGKWADPGVPKTGWECTGVEDLDAIGANIPQIAPAGRKNVQPFDELGPT